MSRLLCILAIIVIFRIPSWGEEACIETKIEPVPNRIIAKRLATNEMELCINLWGIRGHKNDNFKHCIFVNGDELGWTWTKGMTDPEFIATNGPQANKIKCMYQFSFPSLLYGVSPHGESTDADNMPVNLNTLESFIGMHRVEYTARNLSPGYPGDVYARHSLVYDLFLTTEQPAKGKNVSHSITDEIIIMMNYNPEYPRLEGCSTQKSDPIEPNAVFDGYSYYDYHSFDDHNAIGKNYHQFRRVGGDLSDAAVPEKLDMVPFFKYLKKKHDLQGAWLGQVVIGSQLYDYTQGEVRFTLRPSFTCRKIKKD